MYTLGRGISTLPSKHDATRSSILCVSIFSMACMVPSSSLMTGPVTPSLSITSSVTNQESPLVIQHSINLHSASWVILMTVMSLQFTQLFVALMVSCVLSPLLSSAGKQWKAVACGLLHTSHWVFRLHCRAV